MPDPVVYRFAEGIARIAMDDGKLNIMSLAMLKALDAAFDRAEKDKAVVILSSAREGIFSAGFDLKAFAANDAVQSHAMVKAGAELALRILAFPTPVVGACRGHAYPMGAFLLLASDARIGADTGFRIGLNEVAIGIPVPSFALELARQKLHPGWLSRTAMTGELFNPGDALTAGFFDRLVPAAEVDAAAEAVAKALVAIHHPSHALTKKRLRGPVMAAMRAAIDTELTLETYQRNASVKSAVRLPA